jgi:sugar fermentation stimulation protein A
LYLVNRTDCDRFGVAADIDPNYARALMDAKSRGVEILGYRADITSDRIQLGPRLNPT